MGLKSLGTSFLRVCKKNIHAVALSSLIAFSNTAMAQTIQGTPYWKRST